jgi:CRP-like cAMP-binding protein
VLNGAGKEAVVAVLRPEDFFGGGRVAGQPIRSRRATSITATTALVTEKKDMTRVLHAQTRTVLREVCFVLRRQVRLRRGVCVHSLG